jgi:hypothetical protein
MGSVLAWRTYLDMEALIASDIPFRNFRRAMVSRINGEVVVAMLLVRRRCMVGFRWSESV